DRACRNVAGEAVDARSQRVCLGTSARTARTEIKVVNLDIEPGAGGDRDFPIGTRASVQCAGLDGVTHVAGAACAGVTAGNRGVSEWCAAGDGAAERVPGRPSVHRKIDRRARVDGAVQVGIVPPKDGRNCPIFQFLGQRLVSWADFTDGLLLLAK